MRNIFLTTITVTAAVAMLSAPSFADTVADDEPAFSRVTVNTAAKTDLASAGFKTYRSRTAIRTFDARYKVQGQGMADKR